MTAVAITGRVVRVIPTYLSEMDEGPAVYGTSIKDYQAESVPLTAEALIAAGGSPLRKGRSWSCFLDLGYLNSSGAWVALITLDTMPPGATFEIYDPITGTLVDTRASGSLIGSTGLYEIRMYGLQSPAVYNRFKLNYYYNEVIVPGSYRWEMYLGYALEGRLHVASGWIDILPAVPT